MTEWPGVTGDFIVSSRPARDYELMFGLNIADLAGRHVLDCCAGAGGFAAAVAAAGGYPIAADPSYAAGVDAVAERAERDTTATWARYLGHVDRTPEFFAEERIRWDEARKAFAEDMGEHPERYVPASLPNLPFDDASFDLTACSYFLFTYDIVSPVDGIRELLRVTRPGGTVGIHPLYSTRGNQIPHESVVRDLESLISDAQVIQSSYEVVPGVPTDSLILTRAPRTA